MWRHEGNYDLHASVLANQTISYKMLIVPYIYSKKSLLESPNTPRGYGYKIKNLDSKYQVRNLKSISPFKIDRLDAFIKHFMDFTYNL